MDKSVLENLVRNIELAKRAYQRLESGDYDPTISLLQIINKIGDKEMNEVKEELDLPELYNVLSVIKNNTSNALSTLKSGDSSVAKNLLEQIINLNSQDIISKAQKYMKIKQDLKNRNINIDRIADGLGKGLDKHIKPLVATLISLGFNTRQSCEGHKDHGEPFPWVDLFPNSNFERLTQVIANFNQTLKINWLLSKTGGGRVTSTVDIIRNDNNELKKKEINKILSVCKSIIKENNFDLQAHNMKNYWICVIPLKGVENEDLKKIYEILKSHIKSPYDLRINITKEEPISYRLYATNGSLKEMQKNILQLSDYLTENF